MPDLLIVDDSEFDIALMKKAARTLKGWSVDFARDGCAALARLQHERFDLLLTDLHMPNMNGLQLLENVIRHEIDVPTVIMTSRGSEETTMQALRTGAVNYIAKKHLMFQLPETVASVMRARESVAAQIIPLSCLQDWQGRFTIPNGTEALGDVVAFIVRVADQLGELSQCDRTRLSVALNEALSNAMLHGNLEVGSITTRDPGERSRQIDLRRGEEPYRSRRITVSVEVSRAELKCHISDEGRGFDTSSLNTLDAPQDFSAHSGHGLVLMRSFMDECRHSRNGSTVTLRKILRTGQELTPTAQSVLSESIPTGDPVALVERIQRQLSQTSEDEAMPAGSADCSTHDPSAVEQSRIWV